MASWSKEFLLEFIELFKTQEPLWFINSKDYYNKGKRNAGYDLLLDKVLTIEPTANRDTITKKINDLRSTFRKEYKKVQASMVTGSSADEIYTPKLWYYKELLFLKDQEEPLPSTSSIDISVENPSTDESNIESIQSPDTPRPESSLSSSSRSFKRKQPNNSSSESQAVLRMVGDRLASLRQEDEYDIIGKNVAAKLRSLDSLQKLYAEKIINDTLFEAQLNNLSRCSRLSNSSLPNLAYAQCAPNQQTDDNLYLNQAQQPVFRGTGCELIMRVDSEQPLPSLVELSAVDFSGI